MTLDQVMGVIQILAAVAIMAFLGYVFRKDWKRTK